MVRCDASGKPTVGDANTECGVSRIAASAEHRPHRTRHRRVDECSKRLVATDVPRRTARRKDDYPRCGDFDEWCVRDDCTNDWFEYATRTAPERSCERRPVRKLDDYDTRGGVEHGDGAAGDVGHGNVIVRSRGEAQRDLRRAPARCAA